MHGGPLIPELAFAPPIANEFGSSVRRYVRSVARIFTYPVYSVDDLGAKLCLCSPPTDYISYNSMVLPYVRTFTHRARASKGKEDPYVLHGTYCTVLRTVLYEYR